MNKITLPACDDAAAFAALANNDKVASHPSLKPFVAAIQTGYTHYVNNGGNPFTVANVPLSANIADYLRKHYNSPNTDLAHITLMREETEHQPCPMCGSFHRGTLDHLLPKNTYPAFAIFSRNLVPACKCNSKRKEILKGPLPDQRILHPYFDDCLAERLVGADFTALGPIPRVGLKLQVSITHPDYAAIDFHFRSIVERTAIRNWLRDRWVKLCRKPSLVVRALRQNPAALADLKDILIEERNLLDESHSSKNNWESVFITGLLEDAVSTWLYDRMLEPGRLPDGPLQ